MKNIAIVLLAISLAAVQLNFARKVGKNRDGKEFPGRLIKTSSGRIFLDLSHSKREKEPKFNLGHVESGVQKNPTKKGTFRTYTKRRPWNGAKSEAEDTWEEKSSEWEERGEKWEKRPAETWLEEEELGKWKEKTAKWMEKSDTRKARPKTGAGWINKASWGLS